jgi:hypothetical protein
VSARFVTLREIASTAGRHYVTVFNQAKRAGLLTDKPAGVQAHRIPVAKANRFIARTWPGRPLFQEKEEAA